MMALELHFLSDSSCALRSFSLTLCYNAKHGTPEDVFNIFLLAESLQSAHSAKSMLGLEYFGNLCDSP